MATRSKTNAPARAKSRAKLVADTALVPVTVDNTPTVETPIVPADGILSNRPTLPSLETAISVAGEGFNYKDVADIANGRAVQSVAYAIMVLWTNWRADGYATPDGEEMPVPDLATCILTKHKDERTTLKGMFVTALLGEKMDTKDGIAPDKRSAIETERTNRMGLIGRALGMAAALMTDGLTYADYNAKLHVFMVKPSQLLEPGFSPLGRLAVEGQPIALNRASYAAMDRNKDDAYRKIVASVDQLNKATRLRHKIKPSRSTPKVKAMDLKDAQPERLAAECDPATLVRALFAAFVATKNRPKMAPNKLPRECWQMLADIAQESDAIQTTPEFAAYVQHNISPQVQMLQPDVPNAA